MNTYFQSEFITWLILIVWSFRLDIPNMEYLNIIALIIWIYYIIKWFKKSLKKREIISDTYSTLWEIYDIKLLSNSKYKIFIIFTDNFWSKIKFSEEKIISVLDYPKWFWNTDINTNNKSSYSFIEYIINNKAKIKILYKKNNSQQATIDKEFKFIINGKNKQKATIKISNTLNINNKSNIKHKTNTNNILLINKGNIKYIIHLYIWIISLIFWVYIFNKLNIYTSNYNWWDSEPIDWLYIIIIPIIGYPIIVTLILYWLYSIFNNLVKLKKLKNNNNVQTKRNNR